MTRKHSQLAVLFNLNFISVSTRSNYRYSTGQMPVFLSLGGNETISLTGWKSRV